MPVFVAVVVVDIVMVTLILIVAVAAIVAADGGGSCRRFCGCRCSCRLCSCCYCRCRCRCSAVVDVAVVVAFAVARILVFFLLAVHLVLVVNLFIVIMIISTFAEHKDTKDGFWPCTKDRRTKKKQTLLFRVSYFCTRDSQHFPLDQIHNISNLYTWYGHFYPCKIPLIAIDCSQEAKHGTGSGTSLRRFSEKDMSSRSWNDNSMIIIDTTESWNNLIMIINDI